MKDRQRLEGVLGGSVEPHPGCVEHRPQTLLALRDIPPVGRQKVKAALDLGGDLRRRQHIRPGSRKLDPERQPLDKLADARHRWQ